MAKLQWLKRLKRKAISLEQIAERKNLITAFQKAAKGKRYRSDVQDFAANFEQNINQLCDDILQAKMPYGHYRAFWINDPKKRLIHAACFEDRVFHHALINLAGDELERRMQPSSFACRKNKGVHKAEDERQLLVKPSVQIQHSKQGVTYCGFRILQGVVRLSRRRKRRYQQRRQYWEHQYLAGLIDANQLQQANAAVQAITAGTDSVSWRRENLKRHPPISA